LHIHPGENVIDHLVLRLGPHYKGRDFEIFVDKELLRVRILMTLGCLHQTKEGKCSIYDKRPDVCKFFWCDNVMRRFLIYGNLYGLDKLDQDDLKVIPPRLLIEQDIKEKLNSKESQSISQKE
jgi:hypothetical protein